MGVLRQQGGGTGAVASVNGAVGVVVLDTQDLADIPFITVVPTGAGDDVAIQAAITAAGAAGGGIVQLLEGTYDLDNAVTWGTSTNNVILQGVGPSTIISVNIPLEDPPTNPWALDMYGAFADYATNNTTQGGTTFTTTTAGNAANFTAGTFVVLSGTDGDGMTRLESAYVVSADAGTGIVTVKSPLLLTLTSVTARKKTSGRNNGIQNLSIHHDSGGAHSIGCREQTGSFIKNVIIDGKTSSGGDLITLTDSVDCLMQNNWLKNANTVELYPTILDIFYPNGLTFHNNLNCTVEQNDFSNCSLLTGTNSASMHFGYTVERCRILKNRIWDSQANGIQFHGTASIVNTEFLHNHVVNSHFFNIYTNGGSLKDCKIEYNYLDSTNESSGGFWPGIQFVTPGFAKGLSISHNNVRGSAGEGINITGASYSTFIGNILQNNLSAGLFLNLCDNNVIANNQAVGNDWGIWLYDSDKNVLTGNVTNNNVNHGLWIATTSTDTLINGNTSLGNGTSALLVADTCSHLLATGNNFRGATVTPGSGTNINIVGNL